MFAVYQLNPITIAVECFHYAFWLPDDGQAARGSPPESRHPCGYRLGLWSRLPSLFLGQWTFRRLEGRFAQEL